jgi:hypothetical protein
VTDRLGRLLLVTLEATRVQADLPVLHSLRSWLDSWRGIGDVERGMARQGYDLQLTRYDEKGGRATFYRDGALDHERHGLSVGARRGTRCRGQRGRHYDRLSAMASRRAFRDPTPGNSHAIDQQLAWPAQQAAEQAARADRLRRPLSAEALGGLDIHDRSITPEFTGLSGRTPQ